MDMRSQLVRVVVSICMYSYVSSLLHTTVHSICALFSIQSKGHCECPMDSTGHVESMGHTQWPFDWMEKSAHWPFDWKRVHTYMEWTVVPRVHNQECATPILSCDGMGSLTAEF